MRKGKGGWGLSLAGARVSPRWMRAGGVGGGTGVEPKGRSRQGERKEAEWVSPALLGLTTYHHLVAADQ